MVRRSNSSLTHPRNFLPPADLTIVSITVVFAPAAHVEYLQTLRIHSDGQCRAAADEAKADSSTACFARLYGSVTWVCCGLWAYRGFACPEECVQALRPRRADLGRRPRSGRPWAAIRPFPRPAPLSSARGRELHSHIWTNLTTGGRYHLDSPLQVCRRSHS